MSRYSKTVACTCRLFPPPGFAAGVEGRSTRGHSQGLDGPQGGEGALGETLDLVVVQGEKREVLQVLEGIGPDAVDLVGIQEPVGRARPGGRREAQNGTHQDARGTFLGTRHASSQGEVPGSEPRASGPLDAHSMQRSREL